MKSLIALALLIAISAASASAHEHHRLIYPGLSNATVLIVRHAEEAQAGPGLSSAGEARASAYAHYFRPFVLGDQRLRIDALVAAADSRESQRSRLTLEPLSRILRKPIQQPFADHHVRRLALWLAQGNPGRTILIAWHHGEIPQLLTALGLKPSAILHHGRWSAHVYDQVAVLHFDDNGSIIPASCRLIREPTPLE
jgi:hypothetical protein